MHKIHPHIRNENGKPMQTDLPQMYLNGECCSAIGQNLLSQRSLLTRFCQQGLSRPLLGAGTAERHLAPRERTTQRGEKARGGSGEGGGGLERWQNGKKMDLEGGGREGHLASGD